MDFNTIKEFHWRNGMALGLTFLGLLLVLVAFAAAMAGHPTIASQAMFIALIVLIAIIISLSRLRVTGIVADGDIDAFKKWLDKKGESPGETKNDISELKVEIKLLKQSVDSIEKKVDNISEILVKVSE